MKDIAARLENEDRLGRLFDMDVLDTNGRKLSREELGLPERRCFVCSEPAKGCAWSRKHSLPVLIRNVERILTDFVLSHTQDSMKEALLGEVTATPNRVWWTLTILVLMMIWTRKPSKKHGSNPAPSPQHGRNGMELCGKW